jgi:uncharacterized protein YqgV (UPF0045/DUF77 family)
MEADDMSTTHLEVLVEPFKENEPGPHVSAAVDALSASGLEPDMGPFATTADGELDDVLVAVTALLRASFDAGATAIQLRLERS